MQQVQPHEWRRYGFGGPPEPWEQGAQRNIDRIATSYYVDILESRGVLLREPLAPELRTQIEELFTTASRHKQEIEYTLRHWATPAERARLEDRLGSLMRIGRRLHALRDDGNGRRPPPKRHAQPRRAA